MVNAPISSAFSVSVASRRQKTERFLRDFDVVVPQPAFPVGNRTPQQFFDLLRRQRLELENLRARNERGVDVEKRIVRGGADEPDRATFDIGQQHVLLGLVETAGRTG